MPFATTFHYLPFSPNPDSYPLTFRWEVLFFPCLITSSEPVVRPEIPKSNKVGHLWKMVNIHLYWLVLFYHCGPHSGHPSKGQGLDPVIHIVDPAITFSHLLWSGKGTCSQTLAKIFYFRMLTQSQSPAVGSHCCLSCSCVVLHSRGEHRHLV